MARMQLPEDFRDFFRFLNDSEVEYLLIGGWEAADQLRANSKLTSSEYCMPILGIIFLSHATNRYNAVLERIAGEKASGKLPKGLPITKAHFVSRRALMLPQVARYGELLRLPSGSDLGTALVAAMDAIGKQPGILESANRQVSKTCDLLLPKLMSREIEV